MSYTLIWIAASKNGVVPPMQSPLLEKFKLESVDDGRTLTDMGARSDIAALVADASELEAAAQLHDAIKNASGRSVPLLILSQESDLETRIRALRSGADAFFAPPLDSAAIAEKIAVLAGVAKTSETYKVMVVDDDPAQANFAAAILKKAAIDVCKVTETRHIIQTLSDFQPDLILMDVYMPDATGIELTTIIRDHPQWLDVPIVYLSAEHDPDKQLDALSAGGEDFLTKPIRPKHLMATVRNRIDRSRRLRARAGAAVAAAHQDSNPALARKHVLETMEKIHASPAYAAKANAIVYLEIDTPLLLLEEAKLSGIEQVMSGIAEISKKSLLPGDRISRFGDFCLIITAQRENPTAIKEFARGIKQTVDPTYFPIDPNPINTSISIGARLIGANDQDASRLIDDALRACHKARSLGDDIIITPPPAKTPAAAISADEREDDLLTRVMHADNLQILYQPVVPLQKDNEALYQCLLRLRAGNGGLLCAGDFLPTIEQTGKILKLDRWVMLKAIVTLRKAQKNEQRQLRLFVSQAESALKDNSRIQWLQLNLSKSKVDGAGLVLEFRFPEITADLGRAREYIAGIRKLGVRVSLNSIRELDGLLRNLHHLPADYIKITEHQIRNYPDTWGELVAAAHELGKRIIVARIEHPELLGQLWANQVDYLQGNFIQQPEEELSYDFTGAILG